MTGFESTKNERGPFTQSIPFFLQPSEKHWTVRWGRWSDCRRKSLGLGKTFVFLFEGDVLTSASNSSLGWGTPIFLLWLGKRVFLKMFCEHFFKVFWDVTSTVYLLSVFALKPQVLDYCHHFFGARPWEACYRQIGVVFFIVFRFLHLMFFMI